MIRKPTFFARYALLILIVVFFCVPFALRGARFSVEGMKNDVRDWLPKDYQETTELEWFRQHFISEQFVLVAWDGCHGDAEDEKYQKFVAQLTPPTPPSHALDKHLAAQAAGEAAEAPSAEDYRPMKYLQREGFIGDRLGLYTRANDYCDWGGQQEKWLRGWLHPDSDSNKEAWYYITPRGELYRWHGTDTPVSMLWHAIRKQLFPDELQGTLVCNFGSQDGPWYYEQPQRLRAQLFKTLTAGPDVLASLTREGGELADDPAEAQRRLGGTLFGPDGRQTCLVLTLSEAAKRNLHLVVGRGVMGKPRGVLYEFAEASGIPVEAMHFGGPPVDNVAIDEEGSITLFRLIGLCAILGLGLSYACFRSITATIMVCFIGGISAVMSVAFVWYCGSSVDAIMMSMPSLVYVLGLVGAAHLINYYHEAVEEHGYAGAPERAIGHGWKPAVLCNVTTAIGLFSLYTSELAPIRKFGLFSALGVLATLIILFTYLPSALELWPQKMRTKPKQAGDRPWLDKYLAGFWERLGGFIIRHNVSVSIVCTLVVILFTLGLTRINTSVNMMRMFHREAKIIQDYEWIEANIGELVPMEIVLRVPPRLLRSDVDPESGTQPAQAADAASRLSFLERMELTSRAQQAIEEEFGPDNRQIVGRALTAATFVRPLPSPKGDTRSFVVRSATSRRLEAHLDDFLHSDYLRLDNQDQAELWRISLRVAGTTGVDYGAFVKELKYVVEPVLEAQRQREQILRRLVALRGPDGLTGSRVLLLGVPADALAPAAAAGNGPRQPASSAADSPVSDLAQTRIFSRTLIDLLNVSRLKVRAHSPGQDPLPENWGQILAAQDCVVVVGEGGQYDLDFLRQHTPLMFDARHHHFSPSREQNSPVVHPTDQIAAVYTGVVPIVYKAQRSLLNSLIESTLWSFLTITPLMMFISRSFWAGLVAMLPNVLPVVMVFGGMGWLNVEVDVGSMMTASIALGVAVDDTIHYLNWFREEFDRLGDRKKAILAAYRHCATPAFQGAVIAGLGMSIFALSTFTPTQRFGYLMLAILWMGVAAELIFFPALLAGPLGVCFKQRKPKKAAAAPSSEAPAAAAAEEVEQDLPRQPAAVPPPHFVRIDQPAHRHDARR